MSDTSSGGKRSRAKKSAKRGKGAKHKDVRASEGVLANLPRTRPQRSSARRDAARRSTSANVEPTGPPVRKPRRVASATAQPTPAPERILTKKRPSKSKVKAKRLQDPV